MNNLNFNVTQMDIISTVKDSDDNFIPADSVIEVNPDGTADFETLADAINFLYGKYSNGTVSIHLSEGTHEVHNQLYIYGELFNIPMLKIVGEGIDSTILENNDSYTNNEDGIGVMDAKVLFSNFTYIRPQGNKTSGRGLHSYRIGSKIYVQDVKVVGCACALWVSEGDGEVIDSIIADKCDNGICATTGGRITTTWNASITAIDGSYAVKVVDIGIVGLNYTQINVTNTTKFSQNLGTYTAQGIIAGSNH